jgi:predicted dehydrogenase
MSTAPLRIGFIGAGGNTTARHLPGFCALPGVAFRAVSNRSSASAERVAKDWGIARVEADWRAVVEANDIDAVCIGTWPNLHAEVTRAALAAGKNVLCEARMAASLPEAEAMLAASHANQERVAQLVPAPHTLAVDAAVIAWLSAGYAGELRTVEVWDQNGAYSNPTTPITWRLERRFSGVNMLTLGIFYEVLLRWLGADADVTEAHGLIATPHRRGTDGGMTEVNLPESLFVGGVFPTLGGATLRMTHSGLEPTSPRTEIRLTGTRGELRWDGRRGVVETRPATGGTGDWRDGEDADLADKGWTTLATAGADAWRVEADFAESVRAGAPVRRTDFASGVRYMRFTDAAWACLRW